MQRQGYRIEKVVFESLPGLYVTGNFYLPQPADEPLPTVLYLCGHAPHPRGAKTQYQDRAAWFAANGFACLILDTLEFGEVPGLHHGLHDLNLWHWLSLGYTPAGTEVWNAMRAIDYLQERPEVDPDRIGATGISGGGAITWYTAALDERLKVAAPVCSTYTFGSQAASWRASGQCDCIYFHNLHHWEFPMVAALIAPRPLLILSGRRDLDFPPEGYHEVFMGAKRIYDLHAGGDSDRIREIDDDVSHRDAPLFLDSARQWMRAWLGSPAGAPDPVRGTPPAEDPEDLACLAGLPADAINDRIHNQFIRTETPRMPPSRAAWDQRRADLLRLLDEKVFRWFPGAPQPFDTRTPNNDGGWVSRYASYRDVTFQTEPGARVRAQLLTPRSGATNAPLLLYVKRPGDSFYPMDYDELLPVLGRHTVLIVHPRFTEVPINPIDYSSIQMTAAWTGRTIAAMQVWDIVRAIEWAKEQIAPASITVYGKGSMGIVALYAALREDRVGRVVLQDPPASHWQGPALLNVLRVTDISEVAAALAPREIVSLSELPATYQLTKDIYRLCDASNHFVHAESLGEAIGLYANARQ
jgi:cephalosporin-C deacetylase-like acetyl esterase